MTDWKQKYLIGSQWKMRNGQRAVVVDHRNDDLYSIEVWQEEYKDYYLRTKTGLIFSNGGHHPRDLIEPWTEPKVHTVTAWLNFYEDYVIAHPNKRIADDNEIADRLACKQFTWTIKDGEVV